ncbi:uncharacterized protein [Amphiura filiformis]|uniref:uncharacterized protein n=1 Tax=Amphiura filiformis TaxID=82378 RepID=UPI003B20D701
MVRRCVMKGCRNSLFHLDKWKSEDCNIHGTKHSSDDCTCPTPFDLYAFPTSDPIARLEWVSAVGGKKELDNWQPNQRYHRVCSKHFVDGLPTDENPHPTLHLGYKRRPKPKRDGKQPEKKRRCRKPVSKTLPTKVDIVQQVKPVSKILPTKVDIVQQVDEPMKDAEMDTVEKDEDSVGKMGNDHNYSLKCYCQEHCECVGCLQKEKSIQNLEQKISNLQFENLCLKTNSKPKSSKSKDNFISKTLKTDNDVKNFTGISNMAALKQLGEFVKPKVQKMRYWKGKKRVLSTKIKRIGKSPKRTPKLPVRSPLKTGPKRKLTIDEEIVLVLMKLRLALSNIFLASLFGIAASTCSSIFNTWIKFLARELQPLIFWPDRAAIRANMPSSIKSMCPSLRCTIDCTEFYIERPRDLQLQALTWSDYKRHNTAKILVAIAPNGMISFLSKAFGGRSSDRYITQKSGFYELLDRGDTVMADRGFPIQNELILRFCSLEIPPASQGHRQMAADKVKKTKKVANLRIHVERAIGRLKLFQILQKTVPISLLPLIDDIITVCAALANLFPPLVTR